MNGQLELQNSQFALSWWQPHDDRRSSTIPSTSSASGTAPNIASFNATAPASRRTSAKSLTRPSLASTGSAAIASTSSGHRHNGEWFCPHRNLPLAEAIDTLRSEGLYHPFECCKFGFAAVVAGSIPTIFCIAHIVCPEAAGPPESAGTDQRTGFFRRSEIPSWAPRCVYS